MSLIGAKNWISRYFYSIFVLCFFFTSFLGEAFHNDITAPLGCEASHEQCCHESKKYLSLEVCSHPNKLYFLKVHFCLSCNFLLSFISEPIIGCIELGHTYKVAIDEALSLATQHSYLRAYLSSLLRSPPSLM